MCKRFETCKQHGFFFFFFFFFDQKCNSSLKFSERSTCTHLHHSDLDSGGQRYLEITLKNSLHTPKARVGGILIDYTLILGFKAPGGTDLESGYGDVPRS